MKNSENLSHLSNEVLIKSYKTSKAIYIGFIIVFILMIVGAIVITVKKGFGIFTMMPIIFSPVFIANIFNYGKIKEEMKSRNLLN